MSAELHAFCCRLQARPQAVEADAPIPRRAAYRAGYGFVRAIRAQAGEGSDA